MKIYEGSGRMKNDHLHHWDGIWHPYKALNTHYNEGCYRLLLENKVKVWNSFKVAEITDKVDWNIDPFENKTWGLYFNSLNWLYSLFWAYDNGMEDHVRMHDFVVDYCQYLEAGDVNEMAWFDHSTSDRLCFLASLFKHPMFLKFPKESKTFITKITFEHISKIRGFYDSKFWFDSNHGVFHALSILNIVQVSPFSKSDYGLELFGIKYLEVSLQGIVSIDDAFTLEQSVYYHQLALNLLEKIPAHMLEKTTFDADLTQLIPNMIESNYWITLDEKTMVSLGDTAFNANVPTEYLSKIDKIEKFKNFPNCGFSIFKFDNGGGIYDHVSLLHQSSRAPHGHFDALSITIAHNNTPYLIDSGGPYKYGDPFRFTYFMSNRAHNNIMINDQTHKSPSENVEYSSPANGIYLISALHKGYHPAQVSRELFIFEAQGVLVVDKIESLKAESEVKTLWHFSPECTVSDDGVKFIIGNPHGDLPVYSSLYGRLKADVISGKEGESPQGWITDGIGSRVPIETLVAKVQAKKSLTSAWFFSFSDTNSFELSETMFSLKLTKGTAHVGFSDSSVSSVLELEDSNTN